MGKHFTAWEKSEMERLNQEGKSHREVGEILGYERIQIKEYFHRLYKNQRKSISSLSPTPRGCPQKMPLTEQQKMELRINELERENELLRSFLHAAGRM